METTIRIKPDVKKTLERMKLYRRETFNDIMERMIEDELELNEKTKREVEEARKRAEKGEVVSHKEVMKQYGL
ncbi:MAG: hypothetical protein ACE5ES_06320 [Candidatus Nanoarchaeia archaeon]